MHGIASDVATADGCAATLEQALAALAGLDVLVNNASAVQVGRRENTDGARAAGPNRRDRTDPADAGGTASDPQQRRRHDGECFLRYRAGRRAVLRDLCHAKGSACLFRRTAAARVEKGGHPCPLYPGETDMQMMKSNPAGPEPGFTRQPASAVADAIAEGIEIGVRGDP